MSENAIAINFLIYRHYDRNLTHFILQQKKNLKVFEREKNRDRERGGENIGQVKSSI